MIKPDASHGLKVPANTSLLMVLSKRAINANLFESVKGYPFFVVGPV
jgi:hypothetical protein